LCAYYLLPSLLIDTTMMQIRLYLLISLSLLGQEPLQAFLAPRQRTCLAPHQRTLPNRPVVNLASDSDDNNNDDSNVNSDSDNDKNNAKGDDPKKRSRSPYYGKRRNVSKKSDAAPISKEEKKEIVAQAAKDLRKMSKKDEEIEDASLLDIVNPFKAGKKLRSALQSLTGIPDTTKSIYLDDRIGVGLSLAERNPSLQRQSDYTPEVLVVGATGEVGRLVVKRLLLDGNFRIRVLVRDLYSKTLNLLGPGVTYCQGDLSNYESLEYALTDVDKIVFCAGAPRQDEADFQDKFQQYMLDTLSSNSGSEAESLKSDLEWEHMESVLGLRAKLAEQVDCIGMQHLIRAYQNVRFADYGASQTAKRSLFKFGSKNEDFGLFAIDEEDEDAELLDSSYDYDEEAVEADEEDYYEELTNRYDLTEGEEYSSTVQLREGRILTKTQCLWMRNAFSHAVFVGKVLEAGEATVVSSRLRSREEPEIGLDLSNGFGGFILRVCSDGGTYEAFIRTELYETEGIEYVCEFTTETKVQEKDNKSRNKFTTVRLGFENFKPVQRRQEEANMNDVKVPQFRGRDMRQLGFRYRGDNHAAKKLNTRFFFKGDNDSKYSQFYLAFDYIKVYRSQTEPEFVYLSDARIPPVISEGMVRHDRKQVREKRDVLLEEADLISAAADQRSSEETYYKYRGEEILKGSGLPYAIVRVAGYNEVSTGEASTIELAAEPTLEAVSRSDVAQVCASALVDPNALNKSFYMSKSLKTATAEDENISAKFSQLPADI
jgi:uncharacterized protein YbjT (DUF2867 family)